MIDKVILTPRLRLVLVESADEGSEHVRDMHIVRSNPQAMIWTLTGASKTLGDTARMTLLPLEEHENDIRKYRASYIIHTRSDAELNAGKDSSGHVDDAHNGDSQVVGQVGVKEPRVYGIPFADHIAIPEEVAAKEKILTMEAGYSLIPEVWGKGFAAEALAAMADTYLNARTLWSPPYEKVHLHAIIGEANPRSHRVAEKAGFKHIGLHTWDEPDVFIGGAMQPPRVLVFRRDATSTSGSGCSQKDSENSDSVLP